MESLSHCRRFAHPSSRFWAAASPTRALQPATRVTGCFTLIHHPAGLKAVISQGEGKEPEPSLLSRIGAFLCANIANQGRKWDENSSQGRAGSWRRQERREEAGGGIPRCLATEFTLSGIAGNFVTEKQFV